MLVVVVVVAETTGLLVEQVELAVVEMAQKMVLVQMERKI